MNPWNAEHLKRLREERWIVWRERFWTLAIVLVAVVVALFFDDYLKSK